MYDISWRHQRVSPPPPPEMTSEKGAKKFHTDDALLRHCQDLGSASDWSCREHVKSASCNRTWESGWVEIKQNKTKQNFISVELYLEPTETHIWL